MKGDFFIQTSVDCTGCFSYRFYPVTFSEALKHKDFSLPRN